MISSGYSAGAAVLAAATLMTTAVAEDIDPAKFEVPAQLVKSIREFCARVAPRKADFVAYVDGYATECGNAPSALNYCVNPLFEGYAFVEFENAGGRLSGKGGLPAGLYRAEVVEAPDARCDAFDAATLGAPLDRSVEALKKKNKCIALASIQAFKSAFKVEEIQLRSRKQTPETSESSRGSAEQIIRLSDNAVVAQQIGVSVDLSDDVSLYCSAGRGSGDLIVSTIPPRAYAPLP